MKVSAKYWSTLTKMEQEYIQSRQKIDDLITLKMRIADARKQLPDFTRIYGKGFVETPEGTFLWSGSDTRTYKKIEQGANKKGGNVASVFYHGTNNPKAIRKNGFTISKATEEESSFMGDNFAKGIYLSKNTDPYEDDGQLADVSEVLKVTTTAKNILKAKGFEGIIKLNKKYKIPAFDDDAAALLTEALKNDGYDGLDIGDELIIFNPKDVHLYEEFETGGIMSEYNNEYLDYILSSK